jgi:phage I-like protein
MRLIAALLAATLAAAGANGAVQLLPAGEFATRDGRPGPGKRFKLSDERGRAIAAEMNALAGQTPIVIDYDHATLCAAEKGHKAPAAGWMHAGFEWRDGVGLFNTRVEWTGAAKQHIAEGEYRYVSPVILFDEQTGDVRALAFAALVNFPAVLGMEPAVAALSAFSAGSLSPQENPNVDLLTALIAALGLAAGADQAAVLSAVDQLKTKAAAPPKALLPAALSAALGLKDGADEAAALSAVAALQKPDATQLQTMAALQTQVAALQAQINGEKLSGLVSQALTDGKLLPAQKDWALELGRKDMAALSAYIAGAPVLTGLASQSGGKGAEGGSSAAALAGDVELMRTGFGLTQEQWDRAAKHAAKKAA